jgi:hypothetical protein
MLYHAQLGQGEADEDPDGEERHQSRDQHDEDGFRAVGHG